MAGCLFGILGDEPLQLGLGLLMFEVGLPGAGKDTGELCPGIGGGHIDHTHRRDPRLWRLNAKGFWFLAALDTAPELPLGGDNEVLIERIGMGQDLHPLASSRNHREHRGPCRHHPHIMLQLRHVLRSRRLFRERPRQHEFGFENRIAARHPAIQGRRHPFERRMEHPLLNTRDHLPGIGLIPAPVQVLGHDAKLNDEVGR